MGSCSKLPISVDEGDLNLLHRVQPGHGSSADSGGGAGLALCCVPPSRMAAADAGLCCFQQGTLMDAICENSVHVIWRATVAMAIGQSYSHVVLLCSVH
jgi:hypothetical protein